MAVTLIDTTYQDLLERAALLSPTQQKTLIRDLLMLWGKSRPLSPNERIWLLDFTSFDTVFLEQPSIRREDWYDDDGR